MGDIDFEEQLHLEELEKQKKEEESRRTRVDEDGTEFIWDPQKKAWFPKIDDNFIAKYQMNYGTETEADTGGDSTSTPSSREAEYYNWYNNIACRKQKKKDKNTDEEQTNEEAQASYEEYYRKYYEYYNYYQQQNDSAESTKEGEETENKQDGNEEQKTYTEQEWLDYYRYYGYDVSEYYADQVQVDEEESEEVTKEEDEDTKIGDKKGKKRKNEKEKTEATTTQGWFEVEEDKNTNVYVSGLPTDITETEFKEIMNKCGLILYDAKTNKPKLKLYKDAEGKPKGDGLCCYIKVESVELALQILDGSDVRGNTMHVERAQFELKGSYDPNKRRKLTNKEKRKFKLKQAKLLDWRFEKQEEEEGRPKHERVIVLRQMFDPAAFDQDPTLINEIRTDLRTECGRFGDVRKVVIYDRHPEGICTVTFKEPEEADLCRQTMHGRWFDKRKISAETWDGKTKYEIQETDAERKERLKKWEDYLEGKSNAEGKEEGTNTENANLTEARISEDATETSSAASAAAAGDGHHHHGDQVGAGHHDDLESAQRSQQPEALEAAVSDASTSEGHKDAEDEMMLQTTKDQE